MNITVLRPILNLRVKTRGLILSKDLVIAPPAVIDLRKFWRTLFKKYCKNCHHPIQSNRDRGVYVDPDKVYHWIENYGSMACPECRCFTPEA